MRNPEVHYLRTPREGERGRRQIVFPDGKIERCAVISAPLDWEVRVAIDGETLSRKTYCVCTSPDGGDMTVDRWQGGMSPTRVSLTGDELHSRLGGNPNEMDTNDIVEVVREELK